MDYTYTYLVANVVMLIIWAALFWWRRDIRHEMLIMSTYFGAAGIVLEFIYTIDWWHPLTVTGTSVGVEDFLFGFWMGGIAAVIYEIAFARRLRSLRKRSMERDIGLLYQLASLGLLASVILLTTFAIGANSFWASVVTLSLLIAYTWYRRSDLIPESIASGVLILVVGYPWFIAAEIFTPGWVEVHWYLDKLSGITLLFSAPLEDAVWGFLAGAYIGPLYEFLREKALARFPRRRTA